MASLVISLFVRLISFKTFVIQSSTRPSVVIAWRKFITSPSLEIMADARVSSDEPAWKRRLEMLSNIWKDAKGEGKANERRMKGEGKVKEKWRKGEGNMKERWKKGEGKVKGRWRKGEGKVKERQRKDEGKVKERRRKGEGKVKERWRLRNRKHFLCFHTVIHNFKIENLKIEIVWSLP